ncbi:MAG: glutamine synthetase family protein [Bacillota bacterium]
MYTIADIRKLVEEQHVRFLRLQFTDIFGRVKNIAVPITELERVLDNQVTVDGAVFTGVPGMQERVFLHPDYSTFILFPWRPRDGAVARLVCNGYTKTGERFSGCSRGVLEEVLEKAHPEYRLSIGVALDFFLFHVNERGKPVLVPQDYAGLCDLSPLDLGENARRDLVNTLDEMGIDVVLSHHGEDPGKNRICLKTGALPAIADKIITTKFVIRAVAQRHGLYASFIPKPFKEYPGAGMSLLLILMEEGKNLFKSNGDAWGLSKVGYGFAAGLVKHAGGLTALSCPSVISYKRLVSGKDPVLTGLSPNTRTAMLNTALVGNEPALEYWIPDAMSNPYLLLSAILSTGIRGVSEAADLPVITKDGLPAEDSTGCRSLPKNLGAAIEALKADAVLQSIMGDLIHGLYVQEKEKEWNEFLEEIHPWEIERYLP